MSWIADTELGRVIQMPEGEPYAVEMACGNWERLSAEQYAGKVSVNHAAVCRSGTCTYHETHDFAAAVAACGGFVAV